MSGARAGKAPPHEATAGGDESDGEEPDDDEFHQEELREEDEELELSLKDLAAIQQLLGTP